MTPPTPSEREALVAQATELAARLRANAGEPWMTIGGKFFAHDSAATIERLLAALSVPPSPARGEETPSEMTCRAICRTLNLCKYIGDKCNTGRCSVSPEQVRVIRQAFASGQASGKKEE